MLHLAGVRNLGNGFNSKYDFIKLMLQPKLSKVQSGIPVRSMRNTKWENKTFYYFYTFSVLRVKNVIIGLENL